jgi:hypothetical protein
MPNTRGFGRLSAARLPLMNYYACWFITAPDPRQWLVEQNSTDYLLIVSICYIHQPRHAVMIPAA